MLLSFSKSTEQYFILKLIIKVLQKRVEKSFTGGLKPISFSAILLRLDLCAFYADRNFVYGHRRNILNGWFVLAFYDLQNKVPHDGAHLKSLIYAQNPEIEHLIMPKSTLDTSTKCGEEHPTTLSRSKVMVVGEKVVMHQPECTLHRFI